MLNIKLNKAALRSFIQRRKMNALGLLIITAASAVITLLCALTGFARTNILVIITVLLIALCLSQLLCRRRSFRTLHFRLHRKKIIPEEEA